jgi:hypothetical protein
VLVLRNLKRLYSDAPIYHRYALKKCFGKRRNKKGESFNFVSTEVDCLKIESIGLLIDVVYRLVEQLEYWRYMKKHESATMIQRQVRKLQARRARERLLLKKSCAQRIQSAWRWRHRDEVYRDRQKAARKIQSFERMRVVRTHFINFNYESLSLYRASRVLACVVQRSWRGHRGRSITRRTRELNGLPDPLHVKNFDVWLSFQKAANPPARTWGVYSEYYLSGYP